MEKKAIATVRINSLNIAPASEYDGVSFEERLASEGVADLAASIKKHGMIHRPLVREADRQLIAGRDRVE